ncbi:MAG: SAM-dependent methyltransferase, partial [Actinomycetota bacterium]
VMADVGDDPSLREAAAGLTSGEETVVPDGAGAFVDRVAAALRRGYALIVDYGGLGEPGGDAHAYHAHRELDVPLDRPGTTDITAGVDFDLVEEHARERGLEVLGRVTQRDVLLALGFAAWAERERDDRSTTGDSSAARSWAARSRASLLIDEHGLGAHRWLLLATPGLGAPAWLDEAKERSGG